MRLGGGEHLAGRPPPCAPRGLGPPRAGEVAASMSPPVCMSPRCGASGRTVGGGQGCRTPPTARRARLRAGTVPRLGAAAPGAPRRHLSGTLRVPRNVLERLGQQNHTALLVLGGTGTHEPRQAAPCSEHSECGLLRAEQTRGSPASGLAASARPRRGRRRRRWAAQAAGRAGRTTPRELARAAGTEPLGRGGFSNSGAPSSPRPAVPAAATRSGGARRAGSP